MFTLGILSAFGAIACLAADTRRDSLRLLLAALVLTVAAVLLLGGSS